MEKLDTKHQKDFDRNTLFRRRVKLLGIRGQVRKERGKQSDHALSRNMTVKPSRPESLKEVN